MISLLILILLVILIFGSLPRWGYSSGWGYYPSGTLTLILVSFSCFISRAICDPVISSASKNACLETKERCRSIGFDEPGRKKLSRTATITSAIKLSCFDKISELT